MLQIWKTVFILCLVAGYRLRCNIRNVTKRRLLVFLHIYASMFDIHFGTNLWCCTIKHTVIQCTFDFDDYILIKSAAHFTSILKTFCNNPGHVEFI